MSDDLKALAAKVAEVDAQAMPPAERAPGQMVGQGEGGQPGPGTSPPPDPAAELAGLIQLGAGFLKPLFPSLERIYTPETCRALAQVTVPVMAKHGWSLAGLAGKWGEEIACAAVVLPIGLATYQGVMADLAASAKKKPANERSALPDASAKPAPEADDPAKIATL